MDERVLKGLRLMAWERAKGELHSIGHSMYPDYEDTDQRKAREKFFELLESFIDAVENEELIHY